MISNIQPKIELQSSSEKDAELFLKFLNHDFHKQQKNMILSSFPEFKEKLEVNPTEKESIVKKFVSDFYDKHLEKIKYIIDVDRIALNKQGHLVFSALKDLMDANWSKRNIFHAIPTILPFSPFEKNTFFYSILGKIRNNQAAKNIIFLVAHEISHFVFYDTLAKINQDIDKPLSREAEHFLKESLAPAVLNEKPLKNLLDLDSYRGNPELKDLKVDYFGLIIGLVEFISSYYHIHKIDNKKSFQNILLNLIDIISSIDDELIAKKNIWNRHGMNMDKDLLVLSEYSSPIVIKRAL